MCSCICRPCSSLYCTISAICSATLYTAQYTDSAGLLGHGGWGCRCQGLSLLLPGVEFSAAECWVCCCLRLSLLLPGVEFASAGVNFAGAGDRVCCCQGLNFLLPAVEFPAARGSVCCCRGLSLLLPEQSKLFAILSILFIFLVKKASNMQDRNTK